MPLLDRLKKLLPAGRQTVKRLEFVRLLERQTLHEREAKTRLERLVPSADQDFWLHLIWREWMDAFSYLPGRAEALAPLLDLARRAASGIPDSDLDLYAQPAWRALRDLTGPAECVQTYFCNACSRTHPRAGMSGFLDDIDWSCLGCGNMFFKDGRDEEPPPPCRCGGQFTAPSNGCPWCGQPGCIATHTVSAYEYFETHEYTWLQ